MCDLVGHGEKFCEKIFDTPLEMIEKPYGAWMRAEPRRRSHTIGIKWLKQGGPPPVTNQGTNPVRKGGDGVEQTAGKVSTEIKQNPVIIGIEKDFVEIIKQIGLIGGDGGIRGRLNEVGVIITTSNFATGRDIVTDSEDNGLISLDPKRRRVEEPNTNNPNKETEPEDVTMTEEQSNEAHNQKNLLPAGSARQTRLEL